MKHFKKLFDLFFLITIFMSACSKQNGTNTLGSNGASQPESVRSFLVSRTPDSHNSQTKAVATATTAEIENVPMITIPAGEFIMGSTREDVSKWRDAWNEDNKTTASSYAFVNELPQLIVYLDTFEIDQVEVTNERYLTCVNASICQPPSKGTYQNPAYADHPVVYVTHEDAQTYCQWVGKRLPTEAEWEKAARGEDGNVYPWGNEWDPNKINLQVAELPVGSVPDSASPYGVLDMIGSVAELVDGLYEPYPGGLELVNQGSSLARGVVYRYQPEYKLNLHMRTAARGLSVGNDFDAGFRCVRGSQPLALTSAMVESLAPTPIPTPESVDLTNMALIPTGAFVMGTDNLYHPSDTGESPAHPVYLDEYYIDIYEVTWQQFADFVNILGELDFICDGYPCAYTSGHSYDFSKELREVNGHYEPLTNNEQFPAMVTWYGAQSYCQSLGKRLPTEAEWEKAARWTDQRLYPWGDEWDYSNEIMHPYERVATGSHPEDISPYGVFDMVGNAEEWVFDWYKRDYYSFSPSHNPTGPTYVGLFDGRDYHFILPVSDHNPIELVYIDRYGTPKTIRGNSPIGGVTARLSSSPNIPRGFRCVSSTHLENIELDGNMSYLEAWLLLGLILAVLGWLGWNGRKPTS